MIPYIDDENENNVKAAETAMDETDFGLTRGTYLELSGIFDDVEDEKEQQVQTVVNAEAKQSFKASKGYLIADAVQLVLYYLIILLNVSLIVDYYLHGELNRLLALFLIFFLASTLRALTSYNIHRNDLNLRNVLLRNRLKTFYLCVKFLLSALQLDFLVWSYKKMKALREGNGDKYRFYGRCLREYLNIQCYIECTLLLVYQFFLLNEHLVNTKHVVSYSLLSKFTIAMNLVAILYESTYLFELKVKSLTVYWRVCTMALACAWNACIIVPRLLLISMFLLVVDLKADNFTYVFIFGYINLMLFLMVNFIEFNYQHLVNKRRNLKDLMKLFRFTNVFDIIVLYSLIGVNWFYNLSHSCFHELFFATKNARYTRSITCLRMFFEVLYYTENFILFYFYYASFGNSLSGDFLFYLILSTSLVSVFIRICILFCSFKFNVSIRMNNAGEVPPQSLVQYSTLNSTALSSSIN